MNQRLAFSAPALFTLVLGLATTVHAQSPSSAASPDAETRTTEERFQSKSLIELLKTLEREKMPYEIDIRILSRCLGAQCSGIVQPNVPRPPNPLVQIIVPNPK